MRIKFEVEVDRRAEGLGVRTFTVFHKPSAAADFRRRLAANGGVIISEAPCSLSDALSTLEG